MLHKLACTLYSSWGKSLTRIENDELLWVRTLSLVSDSVDRYLDQLVSGDVSEVSRHDTWCPIHRLLELSVDVDVIGYVGCLRQGGGAGPLDHDTEE